MRKMIFEVLLFIIIFFLLFLEKNYSFKKNTKEIMIDLKNLLKYLYLTIIVLIFFYYITKYENFKVFLIFFNTLFLIIIKNFWNNFISFMLCLNNKIKKKKILKKIATKSNLKNIKNFILSFIRIILILLILNNEKL